MFLLHQINLKALFRRKSQFLSVLSRPTNFEPLYHIPEPLQPICALQSIFLVLFCLCDHFFCPFMDLQWIYGFSNGKLASQLKICNLDHHFAQNLALFETFKASTTYLGHEKYIFGIVSFVQLLFRSIYGFTVYKMANWPQNLRFFFTPILPKICPFLYLSEPPYPIYALQSAVLVLFHLHNHFFSPFMDLQCSKWQIGLKIEDFVFWTSILHTIWPFLQLSEPLQPTYVS